MTQILFSLRGVPDDEAEDVRELLTVNHIDYYETPPGNWGISMPAIWLRNEDQKELAEFLVEEYQEKRTLIQRKLYQQLQSTGKAPTFRSKLKHNPWLLVTYVCGIGIVLYVSLKLVFEISG